MADWYIPFVRPFFPSVRWNTGSEAVWLTFDDGPHSEATPGILEVLQTEQVKALFFVLGGQAGKHPDLVRRIRAEGHVIGNHGHDHRPVWFRNRRSVSEELERASDEIVKAGGERPAVFRPPYGLLDPSTPVHARRVGLATVMFSVNSWDFDGGRAVDIAARVVRRARPGDIILLHDNDRTASVARDLVGAVIQGCRRSGLTFGEPNA